MRARDVKGTKSDKIVEQRGRVLPKVVHVRYEMDARDPFLVINEELEELAERGETYYVGEYKLVRVRKVKLNLEAS